MLRRRGLSPVFVAPISVVLAREKGHYIEGLTAYRDGDVDGWLELFAVAAAQAAGLAERYVADVQILRDRWRRRLRSAGRPPRADAAVWAVIDLLPGYPVVTVAVLVAATGRSKPVMGQAVDLLAGAGVLIALSGGRRNRSWEVAGLLDLLAGLEAG